MEQKQNVENNLSWREAIIESLKTSGKPMSSSEIVVAIRERGLRKVTGITPEATVGAQIYTSMKKDGEGSPFFQPSPNQFAFRQRGKSASSVLQPDVGAIATNDPKSDSKEKSQKMPLTYDDPLAAVFLRILAWEEHVAKRKLVVKDIVSEQVQVAREDLGLKRNTKGAPHAFIQSLRKKQPPLLSASKPAEKGWAKDVAWSLRHLPSHRLVRMLSDKPIYSNSELPNNNSKVFQISITLREPALPQLLITIGTGKPDRNAPGDAKGIYFLRENDSFYIGQSDEFYVRCSQHIMKGKKIQWWVFVAPQAANDYFTADSLNAAESLLISFWNEISFVTNKTRGRDKRPAFLHLQPAILLVEAASAALVWLMREKTDFQFPQWSIPWKDCNGRGWPDCYLQPINDMCD